MPSFKKFRKESGRVYDALPGNVLPEREDSGQPNSSAVSNKVMYFRATLPWGINAILLLALIIVSIRTDYFGTSRTLGTYESGFVTDIGKI
jgi:hypothetical protein